MIVDRIPQCDRETLQRHIRAGTPVVITDLVCRWPAFEKWSPDYLAQVCGDSVVPVCHYPDGKTFASEVKMPLKELVALLTATAHGPEEYYLESGYLPDLSNDLYKDFDLPDFMVDIPLIADQVFFGSGSGSCCHIHPHEEAFVFQLIGTKVFHFYHPKDVANLYFEPIHRDYRRSRIDFSNIDYDRFPRARRLERIDVTLERGDAMYIPVQWPHWTVGLGTTFTLTRFFKARLREYRFPSPGVRCLVGRMLQALPFGS